MAWQLDPLSPGGLSKRPDKAYTPYFDGGPGKPSLLDSVNGKHGAVQIVGGTNVTVDNSAGDIVISALDNKVDIAGDTMTGDLNMGTDNTISLATDQQTNTAVGLIRLKSNDNEAKAIIAYVDENDDEVIWLQAHNYLTFPDNQHKHFSVEASDAAGLKQTRLGVGYGADVVDVTVNQANLQINRNSGMTNGNIRMAGAGGGGKIEHAGSLSIYPNYATNGSVALQIGLNNSNPQLTAVGSSQIDIADNINITGSEYISTKLGIGTTDPLKQFTIEASGASGTTAGPQMAFRQNQTTINNTTNSNLGEILFTGADIAVGEEGIGAKIRAQASNPWNGTTNDYPTDILFFTTADGGSGGLTERLRVGSNGVTTHMSDKMNLSTSKTPSSATATGTTGDICWDSNYVYICVATNTWKRSALSTW